MSAPSHLAAPADITAQVVEANARVCAALRLVMNVAFALSAALFGYLGGAAHMRPFALVYAGFAVAAAVVLRAVDRSAWVRQGHFFLLPLLDIPAVTVERWVFISHARQPVGAGLIALTFFEVFVVISLFSLDRRVVAVTTAATVAASLALTSHAGAVPILRVTGALVLLFTGALAAGVIGQVRGLLARLIDRTTELRELLAHVQSAREDERLRIARELHDELGQELTGLRYALASLTVRDDDPEALGRRVRSLDGLIGHAATTTRAILDDLRPRALDEEGIEAALRGLCARVEERAELPCTLQTEGDLGRVDAALAVEVFRLAQESLTNAMRHAKASRVACEVSVSTAGVTLVVRDDGVGIGEARGRGMGLLGMRERAHARGGALSVTRCAAGGTEVRVTLPLPAD